MDISKQIERHGTAGGKGCAIPSEVITETWSKPHTEIKKWPNDDVLKNIMNPPKEHRGYDPKKVHPQEDEGSSLVMTDPYKRC